MVSNLKIIRYHNSEDSQTFPDLAFMMIFFLAIIISKFDKHASHFIIFIYLVS